MTGCLREEWKTEPLPLAHKARNLLRTFPPHIPTPLVQDTGLKRSLERAGRAQGKAGAVWCVRAWEGVRHRLPRLTVRPAPTTATPPGRGLHFNAGVDGLSSWDPVKPEVHPASCLKH